ncbi:hypothetical protein O6H91_14G035600 [Diphasiastrum complanatum]|uniref:Uncharacterized protein n=1 Tax=Diphasiastrum complanatum TaxID=34168 RepID=A0ACC2BNC8_DIPCM|nr:hypothetical protein O6H91_14G035600 [Diphasiastrum complanatum]
MKTQKQKRTYSILPTILICMDPISWWCNWPLLADNSCSCNTGKDLVGRCKPFNGTGGLLPNLKTSLSYKPIPCLSLARDFSPNTLTMTGTDVKPQKFTNFSFGCAHQASGKIGRIGGPLFVVIMC